MNTLAYAVRDSRTMVRRNLHRMQRYPMMTLTLIGIPAIFLGLLGFLWVILSAVRVGVLDL